MSSTEKERGEKSGNGDVTTVKSLGLGLAPLTDDLRNTYKIPKNINGVVITDVKQDSIAADKDIAVGDVISEVDSAGKLTTPAQAAEKRSPPRRKQAMPRCCCSLPAGTICALLRSNLRSDVRKRTVPLRK